MGKSMRRLRVRYRGAWLEIVKVRSEVLWVLTGAGGMGDLLRPKKLPDGCLSVVVEPVEISSENTVVLCSKSVLDAGSF